MTDNVIWESRPSQIFNGKLFFQLALLIFICLMVPNKILNLTIYKPIHVYVILIFSIICYIFYVLWNCLAMYSIRYVLTDERLMIYSGILDQEEKQIALYRINDYKVFSPFFLRIFGMGNIILYSTDNFTPSFTLFAVKNPIDIKDIIRSNVERVKVEKHILVFNT